MKLTVSSFPGFGHGYYTLSKQSQTIEKLASSIPLSVVVVFKQYIVGKPQKPFREDEWVLLRPFGAPL